MRLQKQTSLFLCLLLLLAVLCSSLLVTHGIEHDCTGEDCPVCAQIVIAQHFLTMLRVAVLVLFLSYHASVQLGAGTCVEACAPTRLTPVFLKTRLNN